MKLAYGDEGKNSWFLFRISKGISVADWETKNGRNLFIYLTSKQKGHFKSQEY